MKSLITPLPDFDSLCRSHWPRLCALAREAGCAPHDAEDAVQEVFHKLLRRGQWPALAEMTDEQQWAHLKLLLRTHISNAWRDSRRQKRGGHLTLVALDSADDELERIPGASTPEAEYDRAWIAGTIQRALDRLQAETKPREWDLLEAWMGGRAEAATRVAPAVPSYASTPPRSRRLPVAQRVALHRAKVRLRRLIRLEAGAAEFSELGLRA